MPRLNPPRHNPTPRNARSGRPSGAALFRIVLSNRLAPERGAATEGRPYSSFDRYLVLEHDSIFENTAIKSGIQ